MHSLDLPCRSAPHAYPYHQSAFDLILSPSPPTRSAAILFVVEERTINICDQRFHEFQIYKQRPGIKVLRRTHGELTTLATLTDDRRLIV